jgi:S-adenosylmethionine:tRNA ribosyltransferase-isomerase
MESAFFDYVLPPHFIAQNPSAERDRPRLLFVRRQSAEIEHRRFQDLPELLAPGDLLVLNDTRVLPARLVGRRARTGGRWEGLFLSQLPDGIWEILCQTRGRLLKGENIVVDPGPLQLTLVRKTPEGHWLVQPHDASPMAGLAPRSATQILEQYGRVPLPHYIRKGRAEAADRERYQTVFARRPGAVAAPTAALHFTPRLFEQLDRRSISWTFVTLHVGLGTFQPVQVEQIEQHHMHREWGELSADAVGAINACRERRGRVVAIGTTAVRVLETVAALGPLRPWSGDTDLYIYPPYEFRAVDALVTNFHLPRTSLLLLVSAFGGVDLMRRAYKTAIDHEYRFFSYGDAMLII